VLRPSSSLGPARPCQGNPLVLASHPSLSRFVMTQKVAVFVFPQRRYLVRASDGTYLPGCAGVCQVRNWLVIDSSRPSLGGWVGSYKTAASRHRDQES